MKNYRQLMPIVLIVLMAMSVYSLFSGFVQRRNEYYKCLNEARELAKDGIVADSVFMYKSALDIQESLDLRLEVGNVYLAAGDSKAAISWGENIVKKYPTESVAYEFLLDIYLTDEDYEACFELQEQMQSRKVTSQSLSEKMKTIEYHYELGQSKFTAVSSYQDDMCAVLKEGTWGYVDEYGNVMVERQYAEAGTFAYSEYNGQVVLTAPVQEENGTRYYITWRGDKKFVVKNLENCTFLGSYSDNMLVAEDGGKYAYYDIDFNKLSSDYTYASTMHEDMAVVQNGSQWNVINEKFEIIGETYDGFIIDECCIAFRNKRGFGKIGDKYYLIDQNGTKVSDECFEDAKTFVSEGYAAVKQNGKWGFVDENGKVVIAPIYEDAQSFCVGLAPVKQNGKWGFVNTSGDLVIDYQFEDAKSFNKWGCAFVKVEENWITLMLTKYNH